MNFTYRLFIVFGVVLNFAWADNSYRRCMILPISDNLDGALAFKVYEQVEKYLKESQWCEYSSNSEIINILASYRQNLHEYLSNPVVLRTISEKVGAGSLIQVDLQNDVSAMVINVVIFSADGEDILFKETSRLESNAVELIGQTIINWLEVYEKSIPYQGRVTGVLGDQITIDIGKNRHVGPQDQLRIERPIAKRQHPLLKEIVDWKTELIAQAQVFHVSEKQAQAKIIRYEKNREVAKGDWINPIKFSPSTDPVQQEKYPQETGITHGRLGQLGCFFTFDSSSLGLQNQGEAVRQIAGGLWGIDANLEIWVSRHYWAEIELNTRIGSLSAQSAELAQKENFTINNNLFLRTGYRYLPLGFFYGPRMDFYGGFARYQSDFDASQSDQISAVTISGLMIGLRGDLPLHPLVRAFMRGEFILLSNFQEELSYHGADAQTTNLRFEFGAIYNYSSVLQIAGGLVTDSIKVKFTSAKQYLQYHDSALRLGVIFSY